MKALKSLGPYLKRYWYWYLTGLLFLALASGLQLAIPQAIRHGIDIIAQGNYRLQDLQGDVIAILCLALSIALARLGWRLFIQGAARRIEAELRATLFEHLVRCGAEFYQNQRIGDLMALASNDLNAIRMAISMALVAAFDGIFMTTSILIILFQTQADRTFWYILPLPIITALLLLSGRLVGILFKNVQESFGQISRQVQEAFSGIRVIQAFVRQNYFVQRLGIATNQYKNHNMRLTGIWGIFQPIVAFLSGITILLVLLVGGQSVILGTMSAGDLVASISYLQLLIWPMMGTGFTINLLQRGAASMGRINTVLSTPATEAPIDLSPAPPIKACLEMCHLSFCFPKSDKLILKDINFKVKAKTWLGITGPIGSGKTVLWQTLVRVWPVENGMIFLDEQDINQYNIDELRQRCAIVPQNSFLFSRSIRENVNFGCDAPLEEFFQAVVETTTINRDVATFPNGWDTEVGEKGLTLSGGQKQRVALARALLVQAPILILDDSFASVDAHTETYMIQGLKSLRQGKTTILISHRISAMEACDQVIVLESGQISQSASHSELCSQPGYYQDIWRLQSLEGKA